VPHWAYQLLIVGVVVLIAFAIQYVLRRLVARWAAEPVGELDLVRDRRRRTAVGVIASVVRYVVVAFAIFVLIGLLLHDELTAAAGATLTVAILAFGAQRFLQDVLAGIFILVENQYGVGDFISLQPTDLSGVVESVGLRTTVLRNLKGDVCTIPNGQVTGVRRIVNRYRSYMIDLITREPDEVEPALQEIVQMAPQGAARFLRPPRVIEQRELNDATFVRIRADVPPTVEWLVEDFLVKLLASRLRDALLADPLVYTLDEAAIRDYERTVLVR